MPWFVDAKDIDITLKQFQASLLHTNAKIAKFLEPAASELIIVGAKGTGKTLLLKIRRSLLESRGVTLLPKDAQVDKPVGAPRIFSSREFGGLYLAPEYWRHVWLLSCTLTILKHLEHKLTFESKPLEALYGNKTIRFCCDIFDRIIGLSRGEYFTAYEDFRSSIVPEFRNIDHPISMFIDNVDEYFDSAIADSASGLHGLTNAKTTYWYLAQLGLANAAREINGLNNHVKIYASLRREVFQNLKDFGPLAMQLAGSAVEINYELNELQEILCKNIKAERPANLVDPQDTDPIRRFFGKHCASISHPVTAEEEEIDAFLIRHTLWRPRDIAYMGRKISDVDPNRRTPEKISELINQAATDIAAFYINESRPHLSNLNEPILYPLLPSNIITREQMVKISESYNQKANLINDDPGGGQKFHIFSQLYKLGLLGHLKKERQGRPATQFFPSPGEASANNIGKVPDSDIYLIHPILYHRISEYNISFIDNLDNLNIVGRGRPWRQQSDVFFVLKADVVNYSKIMANSDLADIFPNRFKTIVDSCKKGSVFHAEISEGDSIFVYDRNPNRVFTFIRSVGLALQGSVFECSLRVGGDAGVLRFDIENDAPVNLRGGALRLAARLEALSEPGLVAVTDRFVMQAARVEGSLNFRKLSPDELPKARTVGSSFNLAKNDAEDQILHEIYTVVST